MAVHSERDKRYSDLTPPRVDILGVHVSAVSMIQACDEVSAAIAERRKGYVCVTGVHGVSESQADGDLREIHNRSLLTVPDGRPLYWLAHRLVPDTEHLRGPDFMLALLERAEREGWRSYFYGGKDGVPELLVERLKAKYPKLQVAGACSPPFRALTAEESAKIDAEINEAKPDLVWVGLSTPKQERWMHAHRDALDAPVLLGVGAAFDVHAALSTQAPHWMTTHWLEWLYRLSKEPRRLWRRYLINNPIFVVRVVRKPASVLQTERPQNV